MRFATIAAALLVAMAARDAGPQTVEAVGGAAWTRMVDVNETELLMPTIRQGTIGLRAGFPLARRLGVVADVRLVPRGGGIQYRQTYGYYGDYLELSPRASWHLRVRVTLEGQYTHGLSVVHEPGLFGPSTPFTFRARTRVVAIVLGLGLDVARSRHP